jgi:hypothetical protein
LRDHRLDSSDLGLCRREIFHMGRELLAGELGSRLLRVKDRVSKALREAIDRLPGAKQVEAKAALIEGTLRGLTRSV